MGTEKDIRSVVNNIVAGASSNHGLRERRDQRVLTQQERKALGVSVLKLDSIMEMEYGELWVKGVLGNDTDRLAYWVERICAEGLTQTEVESGIARTLKDPRFVEYPPKLRQFIAICRKKPSPEELGYPTPEIAFRQACGVGVGKKEQMHPAVRAAVKLMGNWELRARADSSVKREFTYNYSIVVDDMIAGRRVPEQVPKAIAAPEQVIVTTKEGFQRGINRLKDALNKKPEN